MRSFFFLLVSLLIVLFSCKKKESFNKKVLNQICTAKVKGFDPIYASDRYSSLQVSKVYEGLYQYHYLKRPYVLEPNLAADMPEVSEDGLTYIIELKKGVLFHDDECFEKGLGRELKAKDVVYSIKRLADPKLQSPCWWILDNKLAGLDEWRAENTANDKVDYEAIIEGVKAIDPYTVKFVLKQPFPQFLYALALSYTFIVPREAVDYYDQDFINHPVGTGPFVTGAYQQSNKIVFNKNLKYREVFYPTKGEEGDEEKGLLKAAGKRLPLVDKVIVNIQTESQPAWLSFEKGKIDHFGIPKDNFSQVMSDDKTINDEYLKKGISLQITPALDVTYLAFNNDDQLFKNNMKLRQAMSLAYNIEEVNSLFYNNRGIKAETMIPPGIAGYDPSYKNPFRIYDIDKAKALLVEAGYPNGEGLPIIEYETIASTESRQMAEYFVKSMEKIGVKIKVNTNTWPELVKKTDKKQAQMFGMAWGADYPDAENFLQLLYSGNVSPGSNSSNYSNPEFDKLFEKARQMQHSPERTALYSQLSQMAAEEIPWIFGIHRSTYALSHSWLLNYKYSDLDHCAVKYYDIDLQKKKMIQPSL